MKNNISKPERILRIGSGLFLASLSLWGIKKVWMLSFLIPVATGLIGKCPLYSALGINKKKSVEDQANDYLPVQSDSEKAAGHPFVGVS